MSKKFTKNKEDFICDYCGSLVKGDGYTNHCPNCLWSKHVDINPGDRQETCHGLMEPIGVEKSGDSMDIIHRCKKCGFIRRNKIQKDDNKELVVALSTNPLS